MNYQRAVVTSNLEIWTRIITMISSVLLMNRSSLSMGRLPSEAPCICYRVVFGHSTGIPEGMPHHVRGHWCRRPGATHYELAPSSSVWRRIPLPSLFRIRVCGLPAYQEALWSHILSVWIFIIDHRFLSLFPRPLVHLARKIIFSSDLASASIVKRRSSFVSSSCAYTWDSWACSAVSCSVSALGLSSSRLKKLKSPDGSPLKKVFWASSTSLLANSSPSSLK